MRRSVLVKVPSFSRLGLAGQDHVGELARLAEEDVLDHEKFELGEPVLNVVGVRVDQGDFLAEHIHRL